VRAHPGAADPTRPGSLTSSPLSTIDGCDGGGGGGVDDDGGVGEGGGEAGDEEEEALRASGVLGAANLLGKMLEP